MKPVKTIEFSAKACDTEYQEQRAGLHRTDDSFAWPSPFFPICCKNTSIILLFLLLSIPLTLLVGCQDAQDSQSSSLSSDELLKVSDDSDNRTRFANRQLPNFLRAETDYYSPDEIAGHVHKAHAKREFRWREHETQKIIMQTNNLGFRNDRDIVVEKPADTKRILITGDSHVDGVVYNHENTANQLELLLNSESDGIHYEVWNGGAGYYTFQNYWGFLEKFANLQPDVFIVIPYTGNDFLGTIELEEQFGRLALPERTETYYRTIIKAAENLETRHFIWQALNQVYYFKHFPEVRNAALQLAQREITRIRDFCHEHAILLVVALLPTQVEVEWKGHSTLEEAISSVHLADSDLESTRQLSAALMNWLDDSQIVYIDPLRKMKTKPQNYFWEEDHHLNTQGHKLLATTLYETLRNAFDDSGSAPQQ